MLSLECSRNAWRRQWRSTAALMFVALAFGGYFQAVQAQEERGHQLGRWSVLPSLEVGGFYDSNPSASGDDSDGSTGAYVAPNIEAKSDFDRHSVSFELGGRHM